MKRKIILLTEAHSNPRTGKTAASMLRYCADEILAVLDSTQTDANTKTLFGVESNLPIIPSLDDLPPSSPQPDTLMIGIAPPGGKLPPDMRSTVLLAISRGMNIVSGLHDFLSSDPELAKLASKFNVTLQDVRKNNERDVTQRQNINPNCFRVHTVGQDCSVGKMVTSIELANALQQQNHDAQFVATGQTGIMIAGSGIPIDCVTADFINGAAEKLVLQNQHHDILLIEGQGSITHPRYSAVTAGLLHGCMPHALILCYEVARQNVMGMEHIPLHSLPDLIQLYEQNASTQYPCKVIGIGMNTRNVTPQQADEEQQRITEQLNLPAADVLLHGPDLLTNAILQHREELT